LTAIPSHRKSAVLLLALGLSLGTSRAHQGPAPVAYASRIAMEFVSIPAGTFKMGCSVEDGHCYSQESPEHQVTITKRFEMGKYEVTQAQWQSVMGTTPSNFKGDTLPVESVSWNDTREFLSKMNARNDGYHYRLPTEAEWEYAARAGSTRVSWPPDAIGWYYDNSDNKTHPVGQKQANAWGLSDMLGNVYEWVEDWYGVYPGGLATDPTGPATGTFRVMRGGSWNYVTAWDARVSYRDYDDPSGSDNNIGFRVLREAIPR
jgi:formylglycine-generating enzyme required for sulfatase activity